MGFLDTTSATVDDDADDDTSSTVALALLVEDDLLLLLLMVENALTLQDNEDAIKRQNFVTVTFIIQTWWYSNRKLLCLLD